jgi:hypothetical protein
MLSWNSTAGSTPAFRGLEPDEGKLSSPVLRELGAGDGPRLLGHIQIEEHYAI